MFEEVTVTFVPASLCIIPVVTLVILAGIYGLAMAITIVGDKILDRMYDD